MSALAKMLDSNHHVLSERGWKLLQPYRYADSDVEHASVLLELAKFPFGASVLDVGCGVGECAKLMHQHRPDLKFTLVNFSREQLNDCPVRFPRELADAHSLPFADESFDAVMFNHALGNMDWQIAFAESARVLKPGGVMLVNEVERISGSDALMLERLAYQSLQRKKLEAFGAAIGMNSWDYHAPKVAKEYLREEWPHEEMAYEEVFAGTGAAVWRFKKDKTTAAQRFAKVLGRHKNIALHFSGGKDSMASLYLLRPWLNRMTVYWVNTGDAMPESAQIMEQCRSFIPHFVEVCSDVATWRDENGIPSDVVPTYSTPLGRLMGFGETKISDRFNCCWSNVMLPMYQRMKNDGVTCLIRGQKLVDMPKVPLKSGEQCDGFETFYPVENWTHDEVIGYLEEVGAPIHSCYEIGNTGVDCMHCTAWWNEGHFAYLQKKHPETHSQVIGLVGQIKTAIGANMAHLDRITQ